MKKTVYRIHDNDNVAIALVSTEIKTEIELDGMICKTVEDIPKGHKLALANISSGQPIIKYGYPIGHATKDIPAGAWVHTHNMKTNLDGVLQYEYQPSKAVAVGTECRIPMFCGYQRANGDVGVRNEIWIIPTVSCANHTANLLANRANKEFGSLCDGIFAFPHNSGCSQLGEDHIMTQKLLAGIIHNPNAGGILLVSLGCENNNIKEFLPMLGSYDPSRIRYLITQEAEDEIEEGMKLLKLLAETAGEDKREPVSACKLKIAFKCGGSDSLSGITANPLCGRISDIITACKGTAILTEVPEMFGAESILMNRAESKDLFQKVVNLINSFKQYYIDYDQPVYENPSPGNKEGGITTLEEKSLGCVQKGGHAVVTDTLDYGDRAVNPGLNLMTGPGNDNVSITDLVATGAQILLFTTGRGNPLGTAIPCIKISSNSQLFAHKPHWIDFNAGALIDGESMDFLSETLWELVLETASGKQTCSEKYGYREIMLFKNGVLL